MKQSRLRSCLGREQEGDRFNWHNMSTTKNNVNNDESFSDLYTRPTESDSYEDPEDSVNSGDCDSESLGLQIPSGYRSSSSCSSLSKMTKNSNSALCKSMSASSLPMKITGIKDEDRLLMLAKHPNATEQQVVQTLLRQQQKAAARQQHQQQQKQQHNDSSRQQQQVTFSPGVLIDTDTGEAWERQCTSEEGWSATTSSSIVNTSMASTPAYTSFDRAWGTDNDDLEASATAPAKTQSYLSKLWRVLLFPVPVGNDDDDDDARAERDDSTISKQDASIAISLASDKTRKISNIDVKARAKRIRQEIGYVTWADRLECFKQKMFGTREGFIALCLLIILIVAIVVTIVTALASKSNNDKTVSSNQAGNNPQYPSGTLIPISDNDNFMTDSPTFSEQGELAGSLSSTLTGSPTTSAPTASTSKPTLWPTTGTLTLTVPVDTKSPTLSPASPSTQKPTLRPTVPPTVRPTMPPVVQTQPPSVLNFLESSRLINVGVSLVGNQPGQRFGQAIALSADGRVLAVGAPFATVGTMAQAGIVQVFEWDDSGTWLTRGFAIMGRNEGDQCGSDVALSADGSILVVSEPLYNGPAGNRSGNVRAFVYIGHTNGGPGGGEYRALGQEISGIAASDQFGLSISLSADGARVAVGAPHHDNGGATRSVSGQVTIFDYQTHNSTNSTGGKWQPIATMAGKDHLDRFGWKVDLERDGKLLCVGAPRNLAFGGYVECYDLVTNKVMGDAILNTVEPSRYDDNFGHALKVINATTSNNTIQVAIGAPGKNYGELDAGVAVVYQYDAVGDTWSMRGKPIVAAAPGQEDELGFAIDLLDGILVIGSPGRRQVDRYIFQSSRWEPHPVPLIGAANSSFGFAVCARGGRLAVGSAETTGENTGMVNVYKESS